MPEVDNNGNFIHLPNHEVYPHPSGFQWSVEFDKYVPLLHYDPKESVTMGAGTTTAKAIEEQYDHVLGNLSEGGIQAKIDMVLGRLEKVHAVKFDSGKPPMSLLSRTALEEIAKVLEFGAQKYGKNNYKTGMNWSRVLDAPLRHIYAFIDKEDNDPESGISHIAHACCSLMFLLEFIKTHPEFDDR